MPESTCHWNARVCVLSTQMAGFCTTRRADNAKGIDYSRPVTEGWAKATASAVAQRAKAEACPPFSAAKRILRRWLVGTALRAFAHPTTSAAGPDLFGRLRREVSEDAVGTGALEA